MIYVKLIFPFLFGGMAVGRPSSWVSLLESIHSKIVQAPVGRTAVIAGVAAGVGIAIVAIKALNRYLFCFGLP